MFYFVNHLKKEYVMHWSRRGSEQVENEVALVSDQM